MTYETIFDEHDDSIELKKLKKELKKIKADKERGENDLEKTIDILQTDNDIKDYEIQILKGKLNEKLI